MKYYVILNPDYSVFTYMETNIPLYALKLSFIDMKFIEISKQDYLKAKKDGYIVSIDF